MNLKEEILKNAGAVLNETLVHPDYEYRRMGKVFKFDVLEANSTSSIDHNIQNMPNVKAIKLKNGKAYYTKNQREKGINHHDLIKILADLNIISSKFVRDWYKNVSSLDEFCAIKRISTDYWVNSVLYITEDTDSPFVDNEEAAKKMKEVYKLDSMYITSEDQEDLLD